MAVKEWLQKKIAEAKETKDRMIAENRQREAERFHMDAMYREKKEEVYRKELEGRTIRQAESDARIKAERAVQSRYGGRLPSRGWGQPYSGTAERAKRFVKKAKHYVRKMPAANNPFGRFDVRLPGVSTGPNIPYVPVGNEGLDRDKRKRVDFGQYL